MKNTCLRFAALSGLVLSLLAGSVLAETTPAPSDEFQSLTISKRVNAIYPAPLRRQGVVAGKTVVICAIDAEGQLTDYMPLAYTYLGFYDAARTAILQWEFEPARSKGRPQPVVQVFTFKFEAGRDVVDINANDNMSMFINSFRGSGDNYRVMSLAELDAIPTPVELTRPQYPESQVGSGVEGDVVIEFYIDENGDVRFPAVIEQTSIDFAAVAVDAVRKWKFEPPMRNGNPVAALARQLFHFNPSDGDE